VLMKAISECMKQEITKINCIVMFCTYTTGINPNDVEALNSFLQLFEGANNGCLALCFTHSESMLDEGQARIINELRQYEKLSAVMRVVGNHVYFMGCAEPQSGDNLDNFRERTKNVYAQRMRLINFFLAAEDQVSLTRLRFMVETTATVIEGIRAAHQLLRILIDSTATDEKSTATDERNSEWARYGDLQEKFAHEWQHLLGLNDVGPVWFQYYGYLVGLSRRRNLSPDIMAKARGNIVIQANGPSEALFQ
jgi:hypothetical protein